MHPHHRGPLDTNLAISAINQSSAAYAATSTAKYQTKHRFIRRRPMSTTPTTKKPEQPSLIAPPAEIEKPTQPSAAVQASAAENKAKQEGIAEVCVYIPLGKIVPSPTNPRKTFDQNYIAELAVTIARARVHQSIVLREWTARPEDVQRVMDLGFEPDFNPGDQVFQIILGECRWRASQLANKGTIPAVVRNLSNDEVLEMQLIENLTRKDLDPLDEAEGYQALMTKEKGLTGTEIAQRIGKSPQYVSAMVKLCALAEWGKQILRNGWITPGHAVLIARLGDYQAQERAMHAVFNETWNANHHTVVEAVRRKAEAGAPIMSEKALRLWIADNERCDLSKVPWKLDDAELLPAAGACTVCPHRSGSDPRFVCRDRGRR
jgi:ParB/RepB/Spo0J family partition protein